LNSGRDRINEMFRKLYGDSLELRVRYVRVTTFDALFPVLCDVNEKERHVGLWVRLVGKTSNKRWQNVFAFAIMVQ